MGNSSQYERKALSEREKQVLAGIKQGLNNAQIGKTLGISRHAVASCINGIYAKLQLGDDVTREALPDYAERFSEK